MTNLKKISIDGIEVEVDGAMTIIQAAEVAGIEIRIDIEHFLCFHYSLFGSGMGGMSFLPEEFCGT